MVLATVARLVLGLGCLAPCPRAQLPLEPAAALVDEAVESGLIPGAILHVGQGGVTERVQPFVHCVGALALVPETEVLTTDSIFDLASLTKPVATATAVMLLVERGKLKLEAPVADYLPEFAVRGKAKVTLNQLLLHRSGLIADNPIEDYLHGKQVAVERICNLGLLAAPGTEFRYSDVGYILLGWLVERADGRPLEVFCREEIFAPLGMSDTGFSPAESLRPRIAPTGPLVDRWLRGEVHDPRARALGGVAGHAGLFSTAGDLARWCRMLLAGGALDGQRVLQRRTVARMLRPSWLPDGSAGRALGLDVDSVYSSPRGSVFPRGRSLGHSGFTGPALWMDLQSETFVIFLCSRLHPHPDQSVVRLRREVSTAVAQALEPEPAPAPVLTGADRLAAENFRRLHGQRVGLLTHSAGRTRDGRRTLDLMAKCDELELVRVFTPEHGLSSTQEGAVPDGQGVPWGVPVRSLYGDQRRPSPADLEDLDVVVVDLQDVGVRIYTYATTVGYVMEACAQTGTSLLILDRPNPIGFLGPRGPRADRDRLSFISYRPSPLAHGLTLGELCLYFRADLDLDVDLQVLTMQGWRRDMTWEETRLPWRNPSPNLRNPRQALLYPMLGLLEGSNVSVGRGCDQPFEQLGAPWIDGEDLADRLNAMGLAGLEFVGLEFTPRSSKFSGQACEGVYVSVRDARELNPVAAGLALAWQLDLAHSREFRTDQVDDRLLNHATWERLRTARDPLQVPSTWAPELASFWRATEAFRLYPDGPRFQAPKD